jgi:hypothetical protein
VRAGIVVAEDRVFISHRLAAAMGVQDRAHFSAADAQDPEVLPILFVATHLFAYSAVFSSATQVTWPASFRDDSSWLVYVTFDRLDVFTGVGITVHTEPHGADCRMGWSAPAGSHQTFDHVRVESSALCLHSVAMHSFHSSPSPRDETCKEGTQMLVGKFVRPAFRLLDR